MRPIWVAFLKYGLALWSTLQRTRLWKKRWGGCGQNSQHQFVRIFLRFVQFCLHLRSLWSVLRHWEFVYWLQDVDVEMQMRSSGCSTLTFATIERAFTLPSQECGNFCFSGRAWWPPYACCRLLSVVLPCIIANYSSVMLDEVVSVSGLGHLVISEYCALAVVHGGAVGSYCPDSLCFVSLCICPGTNRISDLYSRHWVLSSHAFVYIRLWVCIWRFSAISSSTTNAMLVQEALDLSYDWFGICSWRTNLIVGTCKQDANCNFFTGSAFPWRHVLCVAPAERCFTFHESMSLIQIPIVQAWGGPATSRKDYKIYSILWSQCKKNNWYFSSLVRCCKRRSA